MTKTVIVLGRSVTALSTLRALKPLRREGFRILLCVTTLKENYAYRSAIPDQKIVFTSGLTEGLLSVARDFMDKPVLLFTSDDEVVEVSKNRSKLEPHFTFLLPSRQTVDYLMEKGKFTEFARHHNLTIPKTILIKDEEELRSIGEVLCYPVIIKPYLLHAFRLDNQEQLEILIPKLDSVHYQSMIAQEYIEGADDNLYFCFLLFDTGGKLVYKMTARKLRQWPVSYGTTSLAITVENEALQQEIDKFIEANEVAGYCSIEYKYDAHRDKFFIMEPTIGRFNQQIGLTVASGVNFPLAFVRLLNGEEIVFRPQENNVLWIFESNDLFSYFQSKKYGYLTNFFKPKGLVLFSFSDPMPFLFELISLARKRIKKIIRNARLFRTTFV